MPYGNTEICVRVPTENILNIIEPNEKGAAGNSQGEVENALMNPIGTNRLTEIVKAGAKVVIVLKDSGASDNQMMISAISKELNSAGVKDEDITVIVAYNPLNASTAKSEETLLNDFSSKIRVIHHNCEHSEHIKVGETSWGTKVHLNKIFAEAEVKVLANYIEPHIYAGYSGGRDGVLPGVSNSETVLNNLLLSLNPKAKRGVLKANPVHEDMVEAAHLADVNFVLTAVKNVKHEIVKAFAGDIDKAFDEGVKFVDEIYKIPVDGRADIVIVSSGGSSFDINLFEACKYIDCVFEVAKRGGVVVLVAECSEGYGNNEFYRFMSEFKDYDTLEKSLKKKFRIEGLIAYRLLKVLQRNEIFLVSAMPDYYALETFGMKTTRTANEALRYAFDYVGRKGKVSVISHGNLMIPLIKGEDEKK